MLRKRRTRQHVIADLAVHHVEGFVLRQGWTVERFWHDYGYDLELWTYNEQGEYESGFVLIQVKATERAAWSATREHLTFPLEVRDVLLWREEILPVLVVVYEAATDQAYWCHIQATFPANLDLEGRLYVTASLPASQRVDAEAMLHFRRLKVAAIEPRLRGI